MRSCGFYIKPGPGERADAAIPLPPDDAAVISGRVFQSQGPVAGALVLLTDPEDPARTEYTVSDEQGRFWFGPLDPDRLYFLRVQTTAGSVRTVELGQ